MKARRLEALVAGDKTSDGAGVKLTRLLTHHWQQRLDPFLMLDFFGSDKGQDYIGGFPNHPHRGFETITYMLAGRMRHNDSVGNVGLLHPGAVQWMTAGRGVIHSEMPEQEDGLMNGFQLWLNLPARDKMCEPWYQDIPNDELPEWRSDSLCVRVIAGEYEGVGGRVVRDATQPIYWDVQHLGTTPMAFERALPPGHNAFVVVYQGQASLGGQALPLHHMAVLANDGDGVALQLEPGCRFIVVAGRPLKEPIAQYGPFVMNTREELMQAVHDYQSGQLA
jgi:redox-sensitive bicupin YhaK (pirin superfamily)